MSQVSNTSTTVPLRVRDFPDWVSPIVVKELRQGLRSRMFSVALIGLHVAMLCMFLLSLLAQNENANLDTNSINIFFWIIALVPILLLIPASGNGLIQGEVKSGTIELVKMTSLNWWSIVLGKWSAMVVQTLLLVVSTLPYVVFRYFLGGVDLLEEAFLLYGATLLSLTLSSLGLLSSTLNVVWRVLGLLMLAPSILSLIGGLLASISYRGGFEISHPVAFYACMTVVSAGYIYFFLLMSATFLTKGQETWSGRKRLLGFVVIVTALALQLFFESFMNRYEWLRAIQISLIPLAGMIAAEGMFHRLHALPRVRWQYQRGARWGKLKTVASLSGWPVHLIYLVAMASMVFIGFFIAERGDWSSDELRLVVTLALLGVSSLCVHVVYASLLRWQGNLFTFAVVLNVISFLLTIFAGVFAMLDDEGSPIFTLLGLIYPPLGAPSILSSAAGADQSFHALHGIYLMWIFLGLALGFKQLLKWWKWVRHTS